MSGKSRRTTPFYEELDVILGHRAASQTAVLLSSSSNNNDPMDKAAEQASEVIEGNEDVHEGILNSR